MPAVPYREKKNVLRPNIVAICFQKTHLACYGL